MAEREVEPPPPEVKRHVRARPGAEAVHAHAEGCARRVGSAVCACSRLYRPKEPKEPGPGECCGDGCARCVLDVYDERMERWRTRLERYEAEVAACGACACLDDAAKEAMLRDGSGAKRRRPNGKEDCAIS